MTKTLTKHGNSLALIIDRPVLELLKIDPDTKLDISTDGHVLIIEPVRKANHKRRLRSAMAKANRNYGNALRRLAD
jgi:antitoxin component of MazEF toxin-antitoxin module